ncbi:ChbG/HpnK family deacetylase, partial [Anaplasma marginale]|uniref:ChbG/HpnK family deacetylase n=1 Tax=Anaplasma marginale TaxID=770 RepID=UPI0011454CD0
MKRFAIVNADDFGISAEVNRAIVAAHDRGILTSTSLMVTGDAAAAAVELAKNRPELAVGLHLVLCCGKS